MNRVYWKNGGFQQHESPEALGLSADYLGPYDGGYFVSDELWQSLLDAQAQGYEIVENAEGRPVPRDINDPVSLNPKIVRGISDATGAPESIVRIALYSTRFLDRLADLQRGASA